MPTSRTTLAFVLLALSCAPAACGDDAGSDDDAADAGPGLPDADPNAPDASPTDLGCDVTAPTECPSPMPVYADVEPIFAERCVVCHGNEIGHWPLDTYGHIVDWQAEIRGMVLACSMPPPDAGVPMTVQERETILAWIRCGLPQ